MLNAARAAIWAGFRPGLRSAGVTFFRGNDGSEWQRPPLDKGDFRGV